MEAYTIVNAVLGMLSDYLRPGRPEAMAGDAVAAQALDYVRELMQHSGEAAQQAMAEFERDPGGHADGLVEQLLCQVSLDPSVESRLGQFLSKYHRERAGTGRVQQNKAPDIYYGGTVIGGDVNVTMGGEDADDDL